MLERAHDFCGDRWRGAFNRLASFWALSQPDDYLAIPFERIFLAALHYFPACHPGRNVSHCHEFQKAALGAGTFVLKCVSAHVYRLLTRQEGRRTHSIGEKMWGMFAGIALWVGHPLSDDQRVAKAPSQPKAPCLSASGFGAARLNSRGGKLGKPALWAISDLSEYIGRPGQRIDVVDVWPS
jgi:hypothetical protein